MMSVIPSSSEPPVPRWPYDVYVSFSVNDTDRFTEHLFAALARNRIRFYRGNLPTGGIPRISMVVLSQGYVSSAICLDELVEIVHLRNATGHIFFPIYYQLDPSDVQKSIETLEEAVPRPEGQFGTSVDRRVQRWRAALTEATNSSDWILDANGSMEILKFVEEVLDVVCILLNFPRNTLRMDSCVEDFVLCDSVMADPAYDFLGKSVEVWYSVRTRENEGNDYEVKLNPDANLDLSGGGREKQITLEPKEVVFDFEEDEITSNSSCLGLTEQPNYEDWKNDLPGKPRHSMFLAQSLHNNNNLTMITPSYFYHNRDLEILNLSWTGVRYLPKLARLVSLKCLILRYCRFKELPPEVGELKHLEVLDLEGTEIKNLPENLRLPMLLDLYLHNNHKLRTIPPSFFDHMPALLILNLSRTSIRSLPESIFKLVSLKMLILSYCHRFLRLSPKVGELKQLQVLDLEGTEIMDLPMEIKELSILTCLKLSFYGYMGDGSSVMESDAVVPRGVILALLRLEKLMISVNSNHKWWNACVEDIVTEICTLKSLKTLLFYFPRVELVSHFILQSPFWMSQSLSHFRFIVGHHVRRIMSRRPRGVELELERWARYLEYINGEAIPEEIKTLLQYSTAFFLERHATVKKLSEFGNRNMKQLRCCVVGECNEVEVIIDETNAHEEDSAPKEDDEVNAYREDRSSEIVSKTSSGKKVVLGSLEYLCIYYMKNLRKIWEGPVQPKCLSLLKFLTLRTCPELTTIFTTGLIDNLYNLKELTIDDCPSIETLVSCEVSAEHKTSHFFPNLKKISLHYMPRLVSISNGLHIAPRLEWLSFYNCPKLKNLLIEEVSSKDLKRIEGERSWWEALEWSSGRLASLDDIFVPINIGDC